MRSKCLPYGNKNLRRFDSRQGVEVVTQINSHRPYWRRVAQPNSNRVGVVGREVTEPHMLENIASVIKSCESQAFFQANRNAYLRIRDEQFFSSCRHRDLCTSRCVSWIATNWNTVLWARSIQGETAQCAAATREEEFAYRNMACSKGLGDS